VKNQQEIRIQVENHRGFDNATAGTTAPGAVIPILLFEVVIVIEWRQWAQQGLPPSSVYCIDN